MAANIHMLWPLLIIAQTYNWLMSSPDFNKAADCKLEPEQSSLIPKGTVANPETSTNRKRSHQTQGNIGRNMKKLNYRWSSHQNRRYVQFLSTNIKLFDLPLQKRRKIKIQVMMSNFMNNRSTNQCRSHHQKMLNKFGTVPNIVRNLQHLLCDSRFQRNVAASNENEGCQRDWGVKIQRELSDSQSEVQYSGLQKGWVKEEQLLNQESYVFYKTFN